MRALPVVVVVLVSSSAQARPERMRADPRAVQNELALAEAATALEQRDPTRALEALARVDQGANDLPRFRLARLEGLAHAAAGDARRAAQALERARRIAKECDRGLDDDTATLLGVNAFRAGDCKLALSSLDRVAIGDAEAILAKATCQARELGGAVALDTLAAAGRTPKLAALRVRLLVEAGVIDGVIDDAGWAAAHLVSADEVYALAVALTSGEVARVVAEIGTARFPDDARFPLLLARILERPAPRAAARAATRAAGLAPDGAATTAEIARSLGALKRALRENARVGDPQKHLRQRLAVLIDAQEWDRARSLAPRLKSVGLIDDDAVAYALAYACFRTEHDEEASALLDRIEDAQWFERATTLRGAIVACGDPGGERCAR